MSRIAENAYGDRPYPQSPGFRDTDTSRQAAVAVAGKQSSLKAAVFTAICNAGDRGATANEIAVATKIDLNTVRPRLTELSIGLKIKDSGMRRKSARGHNSIAWERL